MKTSIALAALALAALAGCSTPAPESPTATNAPAQTPSSAPEAGDKKAAAAEEPGAGTPDALSNTENLIGYWFVPHNATVNIQFNRGGRFVFNDYNSDKGAEEVLKGTYTLAGGTLTLLYDDRPKQSFRFYKGKNGDSNYYIEKSDYYFVKGENGGANP